MTEAYTRAGGDTLIDAATFEAAYGESLASTMDLDSWQPGGDLEGLYERLNAEVRAAVEMENALQRDVRREVFPRLRKRVGAPRGAGIYAATVEDLERVHAALLFNGATEACDGTSVAHDTLPVTITQIGVCLVSYQGDVGSWAQRLYRRDLRATTGDALEDVLSLLDHRLQAGEIEGTRSRLSELARRGLMTYAERAILTYRSQAPWRMGHGNPVPVELLTGLGSMQLFSRGLDVLRDLILRHRKFVFVPSAPADRFLLTIGGALRPLEFAVVDSATSALEAMASDSRYTAEYRRQVHEFIEDVGEVLVRGVYRASPAAPPYVFYSHVDHVREAALLAMADSVLQEHRGFPMLIDLADMVCRTTFGNDVFKAAVQNAYVEAGAPFRFLKERQTRF